MCQYNMREPFIRYILCTLFFVAIFGGALTGLSSILLHRSSSCHYHESYSCHGTGFDQIPDDESPPSDSTSRASSAVLENRAGQLDSIHFYIMKWGPSCGGSKRAEEWFVKHDWADVTVRNHIVDSNIESWPLIVDVWSEILKELVPGKKRNGASPLPQQINIDDFRVCNIDCDDQRFEPDFQQRLIDWSPISNMYALPKACRALPGTLASRHANVFMNALIDGNSGMGGGGWSDSNGVDTHFTNAYINNVIWPQTTNRIHMRVWLHTVVHELMHGLWIGHGIAISHHMDNLYTYADIFNVMGQWVDMRFDKNSNAFRTMWLSRPHLVKIGLADGIALPTNNIVKGSWMEVGVILEFRKDESFGLVAREAQWNSDLNDVIASFPASVDSGNKMFLCVDATRFGHERNIGSVGKVSADASYARVYSVSRYRQDTETIAMMRIPDTVSESSELDLQFPFWPRANDAEYVINEHKIRVRVARVDSTHVRVFVCFKRYDSDTCNIESFCPVPQIESMAKNGLRIQSALGSTIGFSRF